MTTPIIDSLRKTRIVAILRLKDLTQAESIVRSLLDGGIRWIEFTLTNADAPKAIERLRRSVSDFADGSAFLGLGSVRNPAECQQALACGAQFVVSPLFDPAIVAQCKSAGIPVMPGALTPTEIHQAWTSGAEVVKLFPATTFGPGYLKDVLAPMPYLPIMPTGGVTYENLCTYLEAGAIAVGIGSHLIPKELLASEDWNGIRKTASKYATLASSWRKAPSE